MFNRDNKNKQNRIDQILMSLIVGSAIGSVLGVSFAPKKGNKTRKELSQKKDQFIKDARKCVDETANKINAIKKDFSEKK